MKVDLQERNPPHARVLGRRIAYKGCYCIWRAKKSGRPKDGHCCVEKLCSDCLTLQAEAPHHTQCAEGRTQQHHRRSTIGNRRPGSETGQHRLVCYNKDVSRR